jgi:hypothetical protein
MNNHPLPYPKENDMSEKRVSIFDLYKKEKLVKIFDNEGNFSEVLIKKLSQSEKSDAIIMYNRSLTEEKLRLEKDELTKSNIKTSLQMFNKEQLTQAIIDIEKSIRMAIIDLMPIEGEENLTAGEKKAKQDSEGVKWESLRKSELEVKNDEELINVLLELRISTMAAILANTNYDHMCISFMCVDPDSKQRIFNDYKTVSNVLSKNIIEELLKNINELRIIETDKETRKLAENEDFLSNGESVKSSTDIPATTEQK